MALKEDHPPSPVTSGLSSQGPLTCLCSALFTLATSAGILVPAVFLPCVP